MEREYDGNILLITVAVVSVLAIALLMTFTFTNSNPQSLYTTTVPITVAPNFASCNGFNLSISQPGNAKSGECVWLGGLMNITLYGGNFGNVAVYFMQINSTLPFSSTYYGSSCVSNSSVYYIPLGNYNITFSSGSFAQINGRCGSATMRLSRT